MADTSTAAPLLSLKGVKTHFPIKSRFLKKVVGQIHAVDGVDLEIGYGETVALVGESGCGKTTLARTIIGLYRPTEGTVRFRGEPVQDLDRAATLKLRKQIQFVFQDPFSSLNPRLKIGDIITEPLEIHGGLTKAEKQDRLAEMMGMMGLEASHANRYPHEFSGGQRQRIGIARALILKPSLLVLDEPVSALDVSIQAQIINLLQDLRDRLDVSYLVISHDLGLVRQIADRVAVMYLGKVVELSECDELFRNPQHPYTHALLAAAPVPDPDKRVDENALIEGDLPSPRNPPSGCRFRTRCPLAAEVCATSEPALIERGRPLHLCACHFAGGPDHQPGVLISNPAGDRS